MTDKVEVRGELLKWARQQQEYSRHEVRGRGGPGESLQREVEDKGRTSVRSAVVPVYGTATLKEYLGAMRVALRAEITPEKVEELLVKFALEDKYHRWWRFISA